MPRSPRKDPEVAVVVPDAQDAVAYFVELQKRLIADDWSKQTINGWADRFRRMDARLAARGLARSGRVPRRP